MIINLLSTRKSNLFLDILPEDLILGAAITKGEFHCQCGECDPEEVVLIEIGFVFFKICLSFR